MPIDPFQRGFFWGEKPPANFQSCIAGPIDHLFVHPKTRVSHEHREKEGVSIIILGLCVGVLPEITDPAKFLLDALCRSEKDFLDGLDLLCGRYVIFAQERDRLRVFHDATGMRSVFYDDASTAIASHGRLICDAPLRDIPFRTGFFGNGTPYPGVRLLTPNTMIEIRKNGVQKFHVSRYWPREPLTPLSVEEAAERSLNFAAAAIRHIDRPIRLALTAGFDSRVMLAAMLRSDVDFRTYTYATRATVDIEVGRAIAELAGKTHEFVPTKKPSPELIAALNQAVFMNHHHWAVSGLMDWYPPDEIAVTANLLEIGRCYYSKFRLAEPPITADTMFALHNRSFSNIREEIAAYGDSFRPAATQFFEDMLVTAEFNKARGIIDPFDQFYWEHRMGQWHGPNMNERDFYADAFIPFNSRSIFSAMLGPEKEERKSAAVFYAMIASAPQIASIPINPQTWPLQEETAVPA